LDGAVTWAAEVTKNDSARSKMRSDPKKARVTKVFK
jgi:hypothetical protein